MNSPTNQTKPQIKWYHRPVVVIIIILCVGPLALPLVWASPAFNKKHKIIITLAVVVLTVWFITAAVNLYNILLDEMLKLQGVLESME